MKYRADIDGIRALAVLSVLCFHAELGCPGGFVGVDIFFVISGYLICQILEAEIAGDRFTYLHFWERRLRRLMPALAVVLLLTTLAGWFILSSQDFQEFGATLVSQPLLATNFVLWHLVQGGYFAEAAEIRPALHCWSLAVEEQFYLLCPLVMAWGYRWGGAVAIRRLLILLGLVSLGISILSTGSWPSFAYFLLPSRAHEIIIGGLCWQLSSPARGGKSNALAFAGVAAIIYALAGFDHSTPFPSFWACLPCLGTAAILITPASPVARFLSQPAAVWVGVRSYSLYLWHWPLIAYWKYANLPWTWAGRLAVVGLSLFFAHLSFGWVERPIRERRWLASQKAILSAALVFSLSCYLVGYALWFGEGIPSRWSPAMQAFFTSLTTGGIRDSSFNRNVSNQQLAQDQLVQFGSLGKQLPTLLLWGDSHAIALLEGLDRACKEAGVRGRAVTLTARPVLRHSFVPKGDLAKLDRLQSERFELMKDYLTKHPPHALLIACRWDHLAKRDYQQDLDELVQFLKSRPFPTWMVLQVPRHSSHVFRTLTQYQYWGRDLEEVGVWPEEHRSNQAPFLDALDLAGFSKLHRLDPGPFLLNSRGLYGVMRQGQCWYSDSDHLSRAGSLQLKQMYRPILEQITAQAKGR